MTFEQEEATRAEAARAIADAMNENLSPEDFLDALSDLGFDVVPNDRGRVHDRITDRVVCEAYVWAAERHVNGAWKPPHEILADGCQLSEEVCKRAIFRACDNDLIQYGSCAPTGWLTEKGVALLDGEHRDRYAAASGARGF